MKKTQRTQYRWTEAQIEFIKNKPEDISWPKYTQMMNATFNVKRKTNTVYQKYFFLKKQEEAEEANGKNIPEIVETELSVTETKEKRYSRTRCRWTPQEELEILVDFYSLSVDEARERWQRPYHAIANRLELICDETEPHHNALLMEATNIIRLRKSMMQKPTRKDRKTAKREAKLAKKQARLVRKMNKLGSEKNGNKF